MVGVEGSEDVAEEEEGGEGGRGNNWLCPGGTFAQWQDTSGKGVANSVFAKGVRSWGVGHVLHAAMRQSIALPMRNSSLLQKLGVFRVVGRAIGVTLSKTFVQFRGRSSALLRVSQRHTSIKYQPYPMYIRQHKSHPRQIPTPRLFYSDRDNRTLPNDWILSASSSARSPSLVSSESTSIEIHSTPPSARVLLAGPTLVPDTFDFRH